VPGAPDDSGCRNFRKPNVTAASPKRRTVLPSLSKLWWNGDKSGSDSGSNDCDFVLSMTMDPQAHAMAGAPEVLFVAENVGFVLSALDVPVVCTGLATPFPTPRTEPPDMAHGVHFNILNNIWNTNYCLWYPFNEEDRNIRSRFALELN